MSITALASVGVGSIVEGLFKGLDSLFTSTEEKEAAKLQMMIELQKPHMMQAMTNLKEAEHPSVFVSGWRPAIGWVCASGLAYQFLIFPFAGHIAYLAGLPADLPALDGSMLMTMTVSMLGLGGLRTFEKIKGVSREESPMPPKRPVGSEGIY